MTTIGIAYERERAELGRWWWLALVTGILWILIGLFVLEADVRSAALIGYMVSVWFLFAGVAEFANLAVFAGWKWLRAILGVVFILCGIGALLAPFQTFTVLAGLVGFLLIVKGIFDMVIAIASREFNDLWWLMLILGLLEIALGLWASGYPGRSAALLIIWVGVGAIVRGVLDIISAFTARRFAEAVAA
jgi:uncharacterized membrane protein HdeD (DUF308 family)